MKKIITLMLSVLLGCMLMTGCMERETGAVRIVMPDGAPALAFAELIAGGGEAVDGVVTDDQTFAAHAATVSYSLVAESELAATMAAGNAEVAIMPTNAAATIYNKGAKVAIAAVNVHGLLYMVGKSQITDLSQLKGKVVYSIGQTGTPGFLFQYVLDKAGIAYEVGKEAVEGKVAIQYVTEGPAVIQALAKGQAEFGILGEPAVSNALGKVPGSVIALDLQEQWNLATDNLSLPQACLVVQQSVLDANRGFVKALIDALSRSDEWIVAHPEEATQALVKLNSTTAQNTTFTGEIIGRCNIDTVTMNDSLKSVRQYLSALYDFNPAAVGGKLPDDGLYFLTER